MVHVSVRGEKPNECACQDRSASECIIHYVRQETNSSCDWQSKQPGELSTQRTLLAKLLGITWRSLLRVKSRARTRMLQRAEELK